MIFPQSSPPYIKAFTAFLRWRHFSAVFSAFLRFFFIRRVKNLRIYQTSCSARRFENCLSRESVWRTWRNNHFWGETSICIFDIFATDFSNGKADWHQNGNPLFLDNLTNIRNIFSQGAEFVDTKFRYWSGGTGVSKKSGERVDTYNIWWKTI